jgi:hypothetical protein
MHRLVFRTALAAAALLSLAACAVNPAGQPTVAGAATIPGTNVAVADVAAQLSQQCALKATTEILVDAALVGFSIAVPGGALAEAGVKVLGTAACSYLKATTSPPGTVTPITAPAVTAPPMPPIAPPITPTPAAVLPVVTVAPASTG